MVEAECGDTVPADKDLSRSPLSPHYAIADSTATQRRAS